MAKLSHDHREKPAGRKSRGRSKLTETDLARVMRASKKVGVAVEVVCDGYRVVINGMSGSDAEPNEWDSLL
ncbi:MAG: hypothetical protein EON58_02390 [Alphaproteobacteria bacterium]|nr:MAG: hypothetical protein EON58_02390 [Alphaproteobacteria bacterium]